MSFRTISILFATLSFLFTLSGCDSKNKNVVTEESQPIESNIIAHDEQFHFQPTLDSYKPKKDYYNFYLTYKTAHPWWDAVALGIEDAVKQFEQSGIFIAYDYLAPEKNVCL